MPLYKAFMPAAANVDQLTEFYDKGVKSLGDKARYQANKRAKLDEEKGVELTWWID